jgi:hypothetical protein
MDQESAEAIMSLDKHDSLKTYCRMLGHEVPFEYCRKGISELPCRRVFDCWFQVFDIEAYMKTHFTNEQIQSICKPAEPKVASLIELIRQAQASQKENA